jgi:hypothetical protein
MFIRDRRRHPRFRCTGQADVLLATDAPRIPARVVDVSKRGCLIELRKAQNLDQDATVELTFTVNRLFFRVRVLAKAIRSDTMVGFQFDTLSERVGAQLEELIEELSDNWLMSHLSAPTVR